MLRPSFGCVIAAIASAACNRAPLPPAPPGPTQMEATLVAHARPANALHRAIDLWWAHRTSEALDLLESAASGPPIELQLARVPSADQATLSQSARDDDDVAVFVELRGAAAQPLLARVIADATHARAEGRAADADRSCAIMQAVISANNRSDNRQYVRKWADKWTAASQASCP